MMIEVVPDSRATSVARAPSRVIPRVGFAPTIEVTSASSRTPFSAAGPESPDETRGLILCAWYQAADAVSEHRVAVEVILFFDERLGAATGLPEAEVMLRDLDPEQLAPSIILAVLNATYPKRTELRARPRFVDRAEAALVEKLGAERAALLLANRR